MPPTPIATPSMGYPRPPSIRVYAPNAAAAIRRLRALYCGPTGYELAHVQSPEERAWLIEAIEEGRFAPPNDPIDERGLLRQAVDQLLENADILVVCVLYRRSARKAQLGNLRQSTVTCVANSDVESVGIHEPIPAFSITGYAGLFR